MRWYQFAAVLVAGAAVGVALGFLLAAAGL